MPTTMIRGYRATRSTSGELVIHDVPIFAENVRGDNTYDEQWLKDAVASAKLAEKEGYLPPLHIYHHDFVFGDDGHVRPAGMIRINGVQKITYRGERISAVMADLIITNPDVQEEVLAKRLPYRSVEILDAENPSIDSLALLDHEVPYFALPMLMVSEVSASGSPAFRRDFAYAKIGNPWKTQRAQRSGNMVACYRRGTSATMLFEHLPETPMENTATTEETDTTPETEAEAVAFQSGEGDNEQRPQDQTPEEMQQEPGDSEDSEGEEGEPMMIDAAAVAQAIETGQITLEQMEMIMTAIETRRAGQMPAAPAGGAPAPAATPGAESMSKQDQNTEARLAAMQARLDAQEADLAERKENESIRADVTFAMQRLEGRPMGADLEQRMTERRKSFGADAFKVYVDDLVSHFAVVPSQSQSKAEAFSGQAPATSNVAAKYGKLGAEAAAAAQGFSNEYRELKAHGYARKSEKAYVESNMLAKGWTLDEAES